MTETQKLMLRVAKALRKAHRHDRPIPLTAEDLANILDEVFEVNSDV